MMNKIEKHYGHPKPGSQFKSPSTKTRGNKITKLKRQCLNNKNLKRVRHNHVNPEAGSQHKWVYERKLSNNYMYNMTEKQNRNMTW